MATLILTLLISGNVVKQVEIGFSSRDYCEQVARKLKWKHWQFRMNGSTPYDGLDVECKPAKQQAF